jgi:hypothetical protein
MSFNCTFNIANGSQTLFILPDIDFSGHKKNQRRGQYRKVRGPLRSADPAESVVQTSGTLKPELAEKEEATLISKRGL